MIFGVKNPKKSPLWKAIKSLIFPLWKVWSNRSKITRIMMNLRFLVYTKMQKSPLDKIWIRNFSETSKFSSNNIIIGISIILVKFQFWLRVKFWKKSRKLFKLFLKNWISKKRFLTTKKWVKSSERATHIWSCNKK
jgi:hypothetical protein